MCRYASRRCSYRETLKCRRLVVPRRDVGAEHLFAQTRDVASDEHDAGHDQVHGTRRRLRRADRYVDVGARPRRHRDLTGDDDRLALVDAVGHVGVVVHWRLTERHCRHARALTHTITTCVTHAARIRDDNGSAGHGSQVKWVNKSEWVTGVTGQCS